MAASSKIAALLATAMLAGCSGGCGKPADPPSRAPTDAAPTDPSSLEPVATADDTVPLLPVLNAEALTARVEAQRAALGPSAVLFEDGRGRPVPWISVAGDPAAEADEFDDALLDSLPGSSGLGGGTLAEAVNGNALGLFVPIEPVEAEVPVLHRFYDALDGLRAGEDDDGKVRVLVYGGSHTDADVYPHYLRSYLQERFGDGGHGFVQVAKPWKWYGHVEVAVEGLKFWKTEHAQRRSGRLDGLYGLLGASLSTRSKRAFGRVTLRDGAVGSRFEVYFLSQPSGGSFRLLADGSTVATIKTRSKTLQAGYHAFELPQGEHTIEVQPVGNGEVRLFGLTIEREEPGVVVDTLGIGGTRAANILDWDETIWGDHVQHRDPELVTLFYGTNEANDNGSMDTYEQDLRAVLDRIATYAPEAACLLIGPGDFPVPGPDGSWLPRPRVSEIIEVQRVVALERGCGFWDTRQFMGGELSMTQWASSRPAMAKPDHIHFTRRGYTRIGMALTDAMMVPYDSGGA